jgi:hypothetical protein
MTGITSRFISKPDKKKPETHIYFFGL